MNKFNPPAELILDGNLSERWTKGNSSFILLQVSPKTNQTKLKHQDYYLQLVQSQERFTIPLTSQMMNSP